MAPPDTIAAKTMMHAEQIAFLIQQPPWSNSPDERELDYFRTWQRVSIVLQRAFRKWASQIYFRDLARFEDREAAYTMLVFSACRPCYGRPRSEFTFDVADPHTLASAWRSLGQSLRCALAPVETRLKLAGEFELAHRYAPVWHQDILGWVQKRPRPLIRLIALEARLVDGVIDLGTRRDECSALRFHRTAVNILRSFHGDDMTELLPCLLEETASVLTTDCGGFHLDAASAPVHSHA